MTNQTSNEWASVAIFRLVGYSLLLLALFDALSIFLPLQLNNLPWMFQSTGTVIERVPLLLIGFVLVFAGEGNIRQTWERLLLRVLSWISLGLGILFLMTIPLLLNAAVQMSTLTDAQVTAQAERQSSQLQKVVEQVNQAGPKDLDSFLDSVNQQTNAEAQIKNPQLLRQKLLTEVGEAKKSLQVQAESARSEQRAFLLKEAVKWNAGSLVAGGVLIRLWQSSQWARRKQRVNLRAANI
jgi:hypothetical protein